MFRVDISKTLPLWIHSQESSTYLSVAPIGLGVSDLGTNLQISNRTRLVLCSAKHDVSILLRVS